MSKVGYTAMYGPEERMKLLNAGVEKIILHDPSMTEIESFRHYLLRNHGNEIVLVSLASVGPNVTTSSLLSTLLWLQERGQTFQVIEQGIDTRVSDFQYRDLLISFGKTDQAARKLQTKEGLERARRKGKIIGRPKIDSETAKRIYFLYHTQNETIRQIAMDCNVSIGTVHKYANKE